LGTILISMVLTLAWVFPWMLWLGERQRAKANAGVCEKWWADKSAKALSDHRAELATMSDQLETWRGRALLAERRMKQSEGPKVVKARSGSELRKMNQEWNEMQERKEEEGNANTAFRAS
jgi:hypothetical protein